MRPDRKKNALAVLATGVVSDVVVVVAVVAAIAGS